jgi:peptidoglycan/LPS O-acetylase OafA/YrhL
MRRIAGVMLICAGLAFAISGFALSPDRVAHKLAYMALTTVWALLLLYNWTAGSNRGHRYHLLSIFGLCAMGVLIFFGELLRPPVLIVAVCGTAIVVVLIAATLRYRKELYENYERSKQQ